MARSKSQKQKKGKPQQFGCVSCGVLFKEWKDCKNHMRTCCPSNANRFIEQQCRCIVGHRLCEVPGHNAGTGTKPNKIPAAGDMSSPQEGGDQVAQTAAGSSMDAQIADTNAKTDVANRKREKRAQLILARKARKQEKSERQQQKRERRKERKKQRKRERTCDDDDENEHKTKKIKTGHSFDGGGEAFESATILDDTNSISANVQVEATECPDVSASSAKCLKTGNETTQKSTIADDSSQVNGVLEENDVNGLKQPQVIDLTSDDENQNETGAEKTGNKAPSNTDNTHVIFAIDFSGSMKEQDVKTPNGKISRWEAVFECVDSFLTQQIQQSDATSACLVSALIFNETPRIIVKRAPLIGNGEKIREALKIAKEENRPHGGTGFSAGFQLAQQLASSNIHDKVIVVFLSDGRPGDLQSSPPSKSTLAMQTIFKRKGKTCTAAGQYIEMMQQNHNNFNLQLICLYDEGVPWMEYLACRYNGTFHNPNLALDDVAIDLPPCTTRTEDCGSDVEDDEVEVMKVKSQSTLIRERYQRAKAAGDIIKLDASSMRSTFSSISATVTAMRSGSNLPQERAVTIKSESAMISYEATRMIFKRDANGGDKFAVAPKENVNGRIIQVSMHPFAQGGLRNVYVMSQRHGRGRNEQRQVAKESKHAIKYNERLKFHLETVKCQDKAALYAKYFNISIKKAIKKKQQDNQPHSLNDVPHLSFICAEVYRLKAPSCPGGFRYLSVEKHLDGSYEKWNNNDGFVNQSDCMKCKVAQAFSHFSYERSRRKSMVVDIQGSSNAKSCFYTDPQLHSVTKDFGRADRGTVGIDNFFATHKCNFICEELGLPQRSGY